MIIPLVLIILAVLSAAGMAYGTQPQWAAYSHGLRFIVLARQMQWAMVTLSILFCLAIIVLVISGKRRAWWLIGLLPVLALFVNRFAIDANHRFSVADDPVTVPAAGATFLKDSDAVVGLVLEGTPYAYPYAQLFGSPVVLQSNHDKRCILLWSPFANRATAALVEREMRGRDLEVVGMPSNALLVYAGRYGQFINGVTAQTIKGQRPTGFSTRLATWKMSWGAWKAAHPDTLVMNGSSGGPAAPMAPRFPLLAQTTRTTAPAAGPRAGSSGASGSSGTSANDGASSPSPDRRIVFIATTQPVALPSADVDADPLNVSGPTNVAVWRDASDGTVHAFDRRIKDDLFPAMARKPDPKKPGAYLMVDADSGSTWAVGKGGGLVAIDGLLKGEKMHEIESDDGVYWGVMRAWFPGLRFIDVTTAMRAAPPIPDTPAHLPAPSRGRRTR